MADLTINDAHFNIIKSFLPLTLIASVNIDAGEAIAMDSNGEWVLATTASTQVFLAADSVLAGRGVTGVWKGDVELGDALSALAYGDLLYTSANAGKIETTGVAGDEIGFVVPHAERGRVRKLLRLFGKEK